MTENIHELMRMVIAAAKKVYRTLGEGHSEAVYHRAMLNELRRWGVHCLDRPRLKVRYRGLAVGTVSPDCVVSKNGTAILIEFKAVRRDEVQPFTQEEFDQVRKYLGVYDRPAAGLLLNFAGKTPAWRWVRWRERARWTAEENNGNEA